VAFGSLSKLARGLARTRQGLADSLRTVLGAGRPDAKSLEDLEATLLAADLGPALSEELLEVVRKAARGASSNGVREALRRTLREALPAAVPVRPAVDVRPRVVFVVGVNGGGKTTTVGKLAALEAAEGRKVLVVAADTFRAAAIEQLELWAERAGVELIRQREGADPAAVVFDSLQAAKKRDVDTVLVDTAGRLHTKVNLMAELSKVARVAGREVAGAPHEVLLVIDATTGQNGLAQAEEFHRVAQVTAVVLTKLDGTAKGGVALAIHKRLGLPIRYVGVGEALDDLLPFDPDAFVDGLLE
jgi:fused signal recognition particle receptor